MFRSRFDFGYQAKPLRLGPLLRGHTSHSTSRITLRCFIRSRACTTSFLSSTANRLCTVRAASRCPGSMYSPRMRLASSTARKRVSWSGVLTRPTPLTLFKQALAYLFRGRPRERGRRPRWPLETELVASDSVGIVSTRCGRPNNQISEEIMYKFAIAILLLSAPAFAQDNNEV
jgi:hypothetical protein